MKIAVSAQGNTPTSHVAPFWGRNAGFVIYDSDHLRFTYLDSFPEQTQPLYGPSQSAEMIVDAGIEVLVVSAITFETARLLGRAGVRIYECISATAWEAIQALKLNLLEAINNDSSCPDHRKMAVE